MNYTEFAKRQRHTGRTSRMIEEAVALLAKGKEVIVIMLDPKIGEAMFKKVKLPKEQDLKIQFTTFANCTNFDYFRATFRGMNTDKVAVLIDHSAIEHQFGVMLQLAHRWDKPV